MRMFLIRICLRFVFKLEAVQLYDAMAMCSFKAIKAQNYTQTRVYEHSFAFFMLYLVLTFVLHLCRYLNDLKVRILSIYNILARIETLK